MLCGRPEQTVDVAVLRLSLCTQHGALDPYYLNSGKREWNTLRDTSSTVRVLADQMRGALTPGCSKTSPVSSAGLLWIRQRARITHSVSGIGRNMMTLLRRTGLWRIACSAIRRFLWRLSSSLKPINHAYLFSWSRVALRPRGGCGTYGAIPIATRSASCTVAQNSCILRQGIVISGHRFPLLWSYTEIFPVAVINGWSSAVLTQCSPSKWCLKAASRDGQNFMTGRLWIRWSTSGTTNGRQPNRSRRRYLSHCERSKG